MSTSPLILLAAGGTGGHLFPAEALGVELMKRGLSVRLATDSRALRYSGLFSRDTIDVVPSETVRSRNPLSLARTGLLLATGTAVALNLLRRLKPVAVVGFGGYPTLPPLVAARLLGIPGVIHEANAVLGRANRFLSSRVSAIATSLPGVLDRDPELASKTTVVGMPVRPAQEIIGGIGGAQAAVRTARQQHEFGFDAGVQGEPAFGQARNLRLQRHPGAISVRLLVDHAIAYDACISRHPRNILQRREVADRHVIGPFRAHAEAPQRKPGEPCPVGQHHLQMLDRHGLGLRGAMDIHELRQDVAGLVLIEKFLCLLLIHFETPVYLPPHSMTTPPKDAPKYGPKVGSHQIRY